MCLRGYNELGFAKVLEGAGDLITRAASLYRSVHSSATPPLVQTAFRKEADQCLAEASDLIAQVRKETGK